MSGVLGLVGQRIGKGRAVGRPTGTRTRMLGKPAIATGQLISATYKPGGVPKAPSLTPAVSKPPTATVKPTTYDPRDATFYGAISQNAFSRDRGIAEALQNEGYARNDYDTAMGQLTTKLANTKTSTTGNYNTQGLLYSGALGKALGDAQQNYNTDAGTMSTALTRRLAGYEGTISGLKQQYGDPGTSGDYGIAGGSLLADAINRQLAAHANDAPPAAAATAPAAKAAAKPAAKPAKKKAPSHSASHAHALAKKISQGLVGGNDLASAYQTLARGYVP